MADIGTAFADALKRMLREKKTKGLTVEKAAKQLGVTRQRFHSCLNGELPTKKRFNRAMRIFDLRLDLKEHSFSKEAFGLEQPSEPEWKQLTLFELLDSISDQDLQVTVKRTGRVFRVHVAIEIPA